MKLVVDIPDEIYKASQIIDVKYEDTVQIPLEVIEKGTEFKICEDCKNFDNQYDSRYCKLLQLDWLPEGFGCNRGE